MSNKIQSLLIELGLSSLESIVPFYPRVRDRDDISVLRCKHSGVIFLSHTDHIGVSYYQEKEKFTYWGTKERKDAIDQTDEDSQRRYEQFGDIIGNKKWLDVGAGVGGVLDLLSPLALQTIAIEPQKAIRDSLIDVGYNVLCSVDDVVDADIDVVTLFHVFEHLVDPIAVLEKLKTRMKPGATLIIEVPHANDFLLSELDLDVFKAFTLWSEHLILHTRQSLTRFLEYAGFENVNIRGFQRYPLANHLYWLSKNKPGGDVVWQHLRSEVLDQAYSSMLANIDKTDTLIATATS